MTHNARPILVLGAQGQVGWELRRTLAPLGPVVAWDQRDVDLTDGSALLAAVSALRPGLMVNAAAYTAVDRAEEEEDLAMRVNALAPGILAEQAAQLGVPLIHYSTDYVFDGSAGQPCTEAEPTAPLNAYGRTKLAGEEAIRDIGPAHLILRTSWVYGPRGKNFLLTMLRLGAERAELRIVDDQFGAPTWARMLAEATAQVVARLGHHALEPWWEQGGTYHLTAAGETSWFGFTEAIVELAAARGILPSPPRVLPIPSAEYPTPAPRPRYSVLDSSRFANGFGLALPHWRASLELALDELVGRGAAGVPG
jgi:dTDP-4-dehydrorhamnose reductase